MIIYYPKPEILTHVPPEGHVIMEASAGTGKTYTLEHLVIELLLAEQDVELDQILVVTFTEKATSELKVRVRKVIKGVLDAAQIARRDPSSPYHSPPVDRPCWTIDADQRRKLERAHLAFDIAPIYTIHAFCQKILTEYAFANQRMFDQQHVEFNQLFERAFTDTMRRTLAKDAALQDWLEAWLETSSVEELQRMMAQVVTSRAEIWPRFREQRLREGLERFGDDLWGRYREVYRRRCDKREVAFKRAQKVWTATKSVPRFLMHADNEVIDFKHSMREVRIQTEEQQAFLKFTVALTRFKPAVAQKFQPILMGALDREKQRTGAYTFDDMLDMFWRSLSRESSGGEWLARTLRRRYRYALIDEFQDTDEVQWKIFRKLFTQGPQKRERLFVIGDPKQAIYGFRNADVHTYLGAQDELMKLDGPANDDTLEGANLDVELDANPQDDENKGEMDGVEDGPGEDVVHGEGAVLLRLRHNYRSTPRLIDAYNTILDQRQPRPFFSGEDINYAHPVKCGDPDRALRDVHGKHPASIVIGQMRRRDNEQHKTSRMDDLYECYGTWVAQEIAHLLSPQGKLTFVKGGEERELGASDIFILTRTRSDEYKIEKYLRAANIPHVFVRQENLFDSPQAQEVYDLLRAIERPRDRSRRLRAWRTAFFAIDLDELTQCREVSETHALYKSLLHWHVLAKEQRFEELFTDILERSGLVRREIFFGEDEYGQMAEYHQLIDVLLEEAHLGRCDIHELVARTRAFIEHQRKPLVQHGDIKRIEQHGDAVQILTMHKSKGLEAPIVFLYPFGGMGGDAWRFHYPNKQGETVRALHIHKPEEKISPKLRRRVEAEDRQEAERLLYVAMTRAEARLYLPFVPYIGEQPCCKSIAQRTYDVLNRRLRDLIGELQTDMSDEERESGKKDWREDFELRDIAYYGMMPVVEQTDAELIELIEGWQPPAKLVEAREELRAQRAVRDHRVVSERIQHMESYSSLKRRAGGYQVADAPVDEQELMADAEVGSVEDAVGEQDLPGGVRTGLFLHAMLEELDYSSLTKFRDAEEWREDDATRTIFERGLKEYGLEPRYLELSQRMIWRALTAVVEVEHGVIYGLGHCIPNIRELEFMYPIPEGTNPEQEWGERTRIERGFMKGYVDYTFEWQGRVFFADWKSDVLDRYDVQSLRQHFEANYTKQAFLYTIALCKMFGIEDEPGYEARFGGAVYCFLRGMQEDSRTGLVDWRASWEELCEFERGLTRPDFGQSLPRIPGWARGKKNLGAGVES